MKTAVAIRHVAFEDLRSFARAESARPAPTLEQQGRRFFDAWLTMIDARP